jgi:hypothetical protein
VRDTHSDGYCVVPLMRVNRRWAADGTWLALDGTPWNRLDRYTPLLTCGVGRVEHEDAAHAPSFVSGQYPVRDLTGAKGVWTALALAHSNGHLVAFGPSVCSKRRKLTIELDAGCFGRDGRASQI